jgi:uncharacterized protein YrrD
MGLEIGDKVSWHVGGTTCEGVVTDVYLRDNRGETAFQVGHGRALLVELSDGRKVIKLESELRPFGQKRF